jgi:hypothetical protein
MTATASEKGLMSILDVDAHGDQASRAETTTLAAGPLPTLDERVDMFLRAVHGPGHAATAAERAAAKARILDAIASEFVGDAERGSEIESTAPAAARGTEASAVSGLITGMTNIVKSALSSAAVLLNPGAPARELRWAAAAAAVIVVCAGWSAVWLYARSTVEQSIAAWSDWEAQAGNTYACSERSVSGYPFRVEVRCADPVATVLAGRSRLTIKAAELRAVGNLLQGGVVRAELTGPVSITGPGYSVAGSWTRAETSIDGTASRLDQLAVVLEGFKLDRMTQGSRETLVSGGRAALEIRFERSPDSDHGDLDLALRFTQASGIIGQGPVDGDIAAVLRGAGDAKPQPWLARLEAWESSDGKLVVKHARIDDHGDVAVAQGTIRLDGKGRLAGRLRVTTTPTNFERLAGSWLGENGRLKVRQALLRPGNINAEREEERQRQLAQAEQEGRELRSLGIVPLPAPDPAKGEITMPLTFINGAILLGTVVIGQVPPLY